MLFCFCDHYFCWRIRQTAPSDLQPGIMFLFGYWCVGTNAFSPRSLGLPRVSTWPAVHHVAGSYPSREHHLPLLVTLLCCRSAYEWRHHHLRYHASSSALGHHNPSNYTGQYGEWNFHIEQMWQASLNTWPNYYLKLSDILTNVDTCSKIIKYRPM